MKKTESPSRITALDVVRIEAERSAMVELALTATVGLTNHKEASGPLAKSLYKGPWPDEVTQLLSKLRDSVENHLLTVYFEENSDRTTPGRTAGPTSKVGIVEPQLGSTTASTPQL